MAGKKLLTCLSELICLFVLSYSRSAMRNWEIQVSKDGHDWTVIKRHDNETELTEPG